MQNTAANRVGRLVEIRVGAGYRSVADVDALFHEIMRAVRGKPYTHFVTVADWRYCPVMSSDAAERALEAMTRHNAFVERSAALASPRSPTAVLQFMRLVRESNCERRRLFEDADALIAWLAESLTPQEVARLQVFVREGAPRAA